MLARPKAAWVGLQQAPKRDHGRRVGAACAGVAGEEEGRRREEKRKKEKEKKNREKMRKILGKIPKNSKNLLGTRGVCQSKKYGMGTYFNV